MTMNVLQMSARKWSVVLFSVLLTMGQGCNSLQENPAISIVTDNDPGIPVAHALAKITGALSSKNITF